MAFGPPPRLPRRMRRVVPTATPSPVPAPPRTPESPTASAFRRRKAEIGGIAERLKRLEFGGVFARDIKKIPKLQVVERIGQAQGREVAGRTYVPQPRGRAAAIIGGALRAVGIAPKSFLRISARTTEPEAAVRHELTHGVLFVRGIPAAEQHRIMDLTRTRGQLTTRLLSPAIRASASRSEMARQEGRTMLQRSRFQGVRRERRKGK